ncbi:hypothetical protein Hdeb2414_s0002g00059181 [Helianthus debilis subsp. tardiflorus]
MSLLLMVLILRLKLLGSYKPEKRRGWINLRGRRRRLRKVLLKLLKRTERDPDDDETLTEIMKRKKVLEDKKKELDEQAAAALAAKKSKLQKETPPAPSESEIDLGVFSAKRGNLLEKIYAASGSQGVKSGKGTRKIDISQITPPTSLPSRTFDLSPPPADRGKRKEDDADVEQVGEGGGDAGVGAAGGGDDVFKESSEAEHLNTLYNT